MEKGVMPTSVNPPLWERARDRQTAKQQWQLQEAANQALSTDNPQQLTEAVRVMAVVRVLAMAEVREADTVVEMAVVTVVVTVAAMLEVTAEATAAPSNNKKQKNRRNPRSRLEC
jgi:hypothetical protein